LKSSNSFLPDENLPTVKDPLNPPGDILAFGRTYVGNDNYQTIGIPIEGLQRHMHIGGICATGKSALLEWLIYGLSKNHKSMFVIDSYGSLVDNSIQAILRFAPEREKDIVTLDFTDKERPISFNPLDIDSVEEIEQTVQAVREMIFKMLNLDPDSAPRALNYVDQVVWALCEANLSALKDHKHLALTLLQVPEFFLNKDFRQLVLQFCTNLSVRKTFEPDGYFEKLGEHQQLDHVMPVLRTFSALSVKDSFSNIFGQSESKIDLVQWIRDQKIVMIKFPFISSKDFSITYAGNMITPLLLNSLSEWGSNSDLSTYLLIDEFQNFASKSYKVLLSEGRKFGLYGISASQVLSDLPNDVRKGMYSNVGSQISMTSYDKDIAERIAAGRSYPQPDDISSLEIFSGWANIMLKAGKSSGPFKFRSLAPPLKWAQESGQEKNNFEAASTTILPDTTYSQSRQEVERTYA
jgi:hypothetical protein